MGRLTPKFVSDHSHYEVNILIKSYLAIANQRLLRPKRTKPALTVGQHFIFFSVQAVASS